MKTNGIRPLSVSLSFLFALGMGQVASACNAHPGVPHEEWLAWVNNLNAKTDAAKAGGGGGSAKTAPDGAEAVAKPSATARRAYTESARESSSAPSEMPKAVRPAPLFRSMSDMSNGR